MYFCKKKTKFLSLKTFSSDTIKGKSMFSKIYFSLRRYYSRLFKIIFFLEMHFKAYILLNLSSTQNTSPISPCPNLYLIVKSENSNPSIYFFLLSFMAKISDLGKGFFIRTDKSFPNILLILEKDILATFPSPFFFKSTVILESASFSLSKYSQ